MQEVNFDEMLDAIVERDPRFQRDAYHFVREALDYTQKLISKENKGNVRHITGQELLGGLRQYALHQYGPMTSTLLEEWGIRTCGHFGEIVFNMVETGLLAKTEKDTRDDFQTGYDFVDAFQKPYWPQAKLAAEIQTAINPPTP
ncbi:MAG: Minf_1886 family protein [Verrucomicrobiota bacterium]